MKQIDMFKWLESQDKDSKRLVKNNLNSFEYRLLDYLKENCVGLDNAENGYKIGLEFGVSETKIRYHISKLRKEQSVIIGSHIKHGYYIPLQSEKNESLQYAQSKVLSELETRIRQNPEFILNVYKKLHEISKNIDIVVQNQISMQLNGWEKDHNMFGDKYVKGEK